MESRRPVEQPRARLPGLGEVEQARTLFQGGPRHPGRSPRSPAPGHRATLFNNLALLAEYRGDYAQSARPLPSGSRRIRSGGPDRARRSRSPQHRPDEERLGKENEALRYYRQSLAYFEAPTSSSGGSHLSRAWAASTWSRAPWEAARKVSRRGARAEPRGQRGKPQVAGSLKQLGELLLAEGGPREALDPSASARALPRNRQQCWAEADVLAQDRQGARVTWETRVRPRRAAARHHPERDPREPLRPGGELLRDRPDRPRSRQHRRSPRHPSDGPGIVDSMRPEVGGEELQALFAATKRPYYDFYVDLLMAEHDRDPGAGHAAEALRESEHARARSLLETLAEADLHLDVDAPEVLRDRKAEIEHQLDAKELQRRRLTELHLDRRRPGRPIDQARGTGGHLPDRARPRAPPEPAPGGRATDSGSPAHATPPSPAPVGVGRRDPALAPRRTRRPSSSSASARRGASSGRSRPTASRASSFQARRCSQSEARCLHWLLTQFEDPPPRSEISEEDASCLGDRLEAYSGRLEHGGRYASFAIAAGESARPTRPSRPTSPTSSWGGRQGRHPPPSPGRGQRRRPPVRPLRRPARSRQGADARPLVVTHEIVRLPSASVLAFERCSLAAGTSERAARSRSLPTRCTAPPTHA